MIDFNLRGFKTYEDAMDLLRLGSDGGRVCDDDCTVPVWRMVLLTADWRRIVRMATIDVTVEEK